MSTVALIESSGLRRLRSRGQYVALSHCWGGLLPLVLTTHNIDTLKDAINLSQLPKTFQDAIALTRFMQVRYLWIDSLCIIQDSHTDWEFEASTMKDVYKHAVFTIAATGARNSGDGLYFDRDVDLVGAVTLPVCWQGLPRGIYSICEDRLWLDNVTDAPLNQRAWVIQERLLSCRTLHLGRDQIAWECQTLQACETFPARLPLKCSDYEDFAFRTKLANAPLKMVGRIWDNTAETYSRGRLTEETDKCIAISGIVEEMQLATADHYFAGLWGSSFVLQMCWTVHHLKNVRDRQTPRRPRRYRAPSWSWLSIDSNVQFYSIYDNIYDILFEVLNVNIKNTGRNNFGSIKGGCIVGRGLLKSALWEHSTDDRVGHLQIDDESIQHGSFWNYGGSTHVTMDLGLEEKCDSVWCLPLVRNSDEYNVGTVTRCIVGVLLVPTGQAEEEYKRVGCFRLEDDLGKSLFKEYTDGPHHSFTIV
ncbi:hypothetical protein IMSHALPRED_002313 [Imshaugia aleurites]|uniref:Heterokaryon incompatibility domain-containing protein n=1 Tax=Imshaugia aleurites TaxID=172621 RepID=A0A8H3IIM8_9LECA|nr:hypothetical protein IMSHALPRED_002313 [Imshaugia aleurites]